MPNKIGRPAGSVTNRYKLLKAKKRSGTFFALVRRTRRNQGLVTVVYVVVRSDQPILANGTILNALKATIGGGRFGPKMRDPGSWMSSLEKAKAAFQAAVQKASSRSPRR